MSANDQVPAASAEEALAVLRDRSDDLNAITVVTEERAREAAAQAQDRRTQDLVARPLEGIAVAVKDVIDIAGYPTSMGSAVDTGRGTLTTAPVVTALEDAGTLTVAKTNCQEFSYGILGEESAFGPVVNPRGADLCTAGSSSGSTALVAAGAVPLAIGTDTAGSVRIPAACTGTIGFKPTFGAVPVDGVFPLAQSCDTVGFFALDVDLLRRAFRATVVGSTDAGGRDGAASRGGVGPRDAVETPAGVVRRVLTAGEDSAAGRLLDAVVDEALALYEVLRKYEAYQVHRGFLESQGERYQPVVRERALLGQDVARAQYEAARAGQMSLRERALALFDDADVLRTPALVGPVPRWDELAPRHRDDFTRWSTPFNVLGWPAITVPVAGDGVEHCDAGAGPRAGATTGVRVIPGRADRARVLPESVQFVAAPGEDLAVLAHAQEFLAGSG